jgi:hypothetical protein
VGIEFQTQIGRGQVQRLPGLQSDLTVPTAVVPIPEETLARFGDDGVDRMSRQPTARRDMDRHHFHTVESISNSDPHRRGG